MISGLTVRLFSRVEIVSSITDLKNSVTFFGMVVAPRNYTE
jgi:hypothetical protein